MARLNFVEMPAAAIGPTSRFYETVFGWSMTAFGPSYACTMTGDVDLGLQADAAEAPRAPLPVIMVDDLDAYWSVIVAQGAAITRPIFAFPGGRRFQCRDPSGNEIAVMQADPEGDPASA